MDRFVIVVMGRFDFLHFSVETVLVIGGILDYASGAIGFHQTVRSLDVSVAVVFFVVALDVVGVWVVHAIPVMIRSWCIVMLIFVQTVFGYGRISEDQVSEQGGKYDQL